MAAREGASTALTPDVLEAKLTEGLKATFVQVSQRRAHHITRSHALMQYVQLLLQTDVQLTQNRHPCLHDSNHAASSLSASTGPMSWCLRLVQSSLRNMSLSCVCPSRAGLELLANLPVMPFLCSSTHSHICTLPHAQLPHGTCRPTPTAGH
jgi:hypothetical protein